MSAPIDVAAQNASLDALLGDGHAAGIPDAWEMAIFNADPTNGGTELTSDGGYARAAVDNDTANWPDAALGVKASVGQSFGTSTDAWSDDGQYLVLYDAADHTTAWFYAPLDDPIIVPVTGTLVDDVVMTVPWDTFSS